MTGRPQLSTQMPSTLEQLKGESDDGAKNPGGTIQALSKTALQCEGARGVVGAEMLSNPRVVRGSEATRAFAVCRVPRPR